VNLESVQRRFAFPIPEFTTPICRTSQKNIRPEWVAPHFVNSSCMAIVTFQILYYLRNLQFQRRIYCNGKQWLLQLQPNRHLALLLWSRNWIQLLVWNLHLHFILLSNWGYSISSNSSNPKMFKIYGIFQALFHRPLYNPTITRNTDQTLSSFGPFANPLNLPDTVTVFPLTILVIIRGDWLIPLFSDIPNSHHSVLSSAG
jgi:hypothetical protein